MIRYNFRPSLVDHAQVLILVRSFYNCSDQDHSFALRKLNNFTYATIKDSDRRLLLKFTKGYQRDVLEWGRIQVHRRPLGFIGVARLSDDPVQQPKDYEKIVHRFDNLISQYESFLYDSRCIIIGPDNPSITVTRKNVIYLRLTELEVSEAFLKDITEFVSSLFVILESKRVDKVSENFERMAMPTAPCEQEQIVSETDTRAMKRRCLGRNKKILADLCLLSGLYQEALLHYNNAVEHLRGVNDYLWMGAALEGSCAASNMMLAGDEVLRLPSKKRYARGLIIDQTNIQVNVNSEQSMEEQLRNISIFSKTELISKYTECLSCFKRYNTGPMEMESHFKFIRALIKLQKKIEVAQIIQSLQMLPLNFNELEQIDFHSVLSSIHEQLSLKRKAAFYKRRAAMYYVKSDPGKLGLAKALSYFHEICPAYKLEMEQPTNVEKKQDTSCNGWPSLQLKVLKDMLLITRKLGNKLDSVRLLCFILERYADQMSRADHTELVDLLEEFSDDTGPLLNEDSKEENVQLIRPLPIIRDFHAKKLAHYLKPLKAKENTSTGPFIFSSLSSKIKKGDEKILWVCGDVSEVAMVVDNPLPAEIKVNNMTLITEGTEFEAYPATLALPAKSGCFPFMLLGTPTKPGTLLIKGYRVEVLGISNTVLVPKPIMIEVTPMLPILKLSSTLPRAPNSSSLNPEDKHYQTLFTSANLYRGHSCTGKVTLENAGKVAVTKLDIKLKKPREVNVLFNEAQVQDNLPLAPGDSIHLDVIIMPETSWKLYNNQDKIEPMLIISYSCEEGEKGGYTREISWVTLIKVMPSLEFSNLELFEIERQPDFCLVCFDVENMTSVSMDVECLVQIDENEIDTSSFSGSLESLDILLESKKKTSVEVKFPRISLPAPKNKRQTIEDVYENFVNQSICFKWKLCDTNYSGVTYFQNINITSEMIPVLKPKHLNINIRVNSNQVKDGQLLEIEKHNIVDISIVLTNFHELDLDDMTLHINPYQRCHHSAERMNQLCLPSGIMNKGIKKLSPGETFEHSCGLFFLYDGEYMIDISCSANRKFGTPTQKRPRAFAIGESEPKSPSFEKRHSWSVPLSPKSVSKKLKYNEADFWAQTFALNVT